jgi:Bifunctional DNA primase/polymerase, N-terminal
MNARQQAALVSALQLPYPSFPCNLKKRPTCKKGFHAAVPPSTVLMSLWDERPGELIGIPAGAVTGIAVLDIDPRNGGAEWYEENKSRLPETRIHRTARGGLHLVYRHKTGLRISESKIASGIDVRADGGYFIWWPCEGLDVRDAPLAEWPAWLEWLIAGTGSARQGRKRSVRRGRPRSHAARNHQSRRKRRRRRAERNHVLGCLPRS